MGTVVYYWQDEEGIWKAATRRGEVPEEVLKSSNYKTKEIVKLTDKVYILEAYYGCDYIPNINLWIEYSNIYNSIKSLKKHSPLYNKIMSKVEINKEKYEVTDTTIKTIISDGKNSNHTFEFGDTDDIVDGYKVSARIVEIPIVSKDYAFN